MMNKKNNDNNAQITINKYSLDSDNGDKDDGNNDDDNNNEDGINYNEEQE